MFDFSKSNMIRTSYILVIIFSSLFLNNCSGQDRVEGLISCLGSQMGIDNYIYNGREYVTPSTRINGSPDFEDLGWVSGMIYTPYGQYEINEMKLDLYQQQLAIKEKLKSGIYATINVEESLIDSFYLGQFKLVHAKYIPFEHDYKYIEKIEHGDQVLLKSAIKSFSKQFNRKNPHGKFIKNESTFWLKTNEGYKDFKSRKDLQKILKPHKDAIKDYFSVEDLDLEDATRNQLINLLKFINELD